mmetsp:Transcript_8187/g.21413  ORF Transcript_8187/g.21413 Transcript_8187/m.21413 type:complete len:205 (-) Transcript_8187:276-890(-)
MSCNQEGLLHEGLGATSKQPRGTTSLILPSCTFLLGGAISAIVFLALNQLGKGNSAVSTSIDFSFQILGVNSTRQEGKMLDAYVSWRYTENIDHCPFHPTDNTCIQYQYDVHTLIVNQTSNGTPEVEENAEWERLVLFLCREIWQSNQPIIAGVSVALHVNGDGRSDVERGIMPYEPGAHGATCTIGDIPPISTPNRLFNLGDI